MKSLFQKYFKFYLLSCLISFIMVQATALAKANLDEEALGNMIENLYANMTPEEQDAFNKEIEYQQNKLMQMSPEERAHYEEMMMKELDHIMTTSPDLFAPPAPTTMPAKANPELVEPAAPANTSSEPKASAGTKTSNKPKPVTIPQEQKNENRQLVKNIIQAIDTILLKTNHMHDITHAAWNKGRWLNLKADLQNLKNILPVLVNSDTLLFELLSNQNSALRDSLKALSQLLLLQANLLKTPDAMGLVTVFEGQTRIIDQARYDTAINNLKIIIDQLAQQIETTQLYQQVNQLILKHAPEKLKNIQPVATAGLQKKKSAPKNCLPVSTTTTTELVLLTQELTKHLVRYASNDLLALILEYQANPSAKLSRKLKWKLSELEVYLAKLIKAIDDSSLLNCQTQVQSVLIESKDSFAILAQIIETLNLQANLLPNSELNNLYQKFIAKKLLL